jgi:ketosteroid isomerase-like protein
MFQRLARMMVRRSLAAHRRHDVEAVLKTFSKDVRFRFPGRNSWAGEFRGIDAVRPWLRRFYEVGLELDADEILIGGWPWDTRVAIHFADRLKTSDGAVVYENTGFIYAKSAWGRIREYDVIEDTEKVAQLDAWLASRGAEVTHVMKTTPREVTSPS